MSIATRKRQRVPLKSSSWDERAHGSRGRAVWCGLAGLGRLGEAAAIRGIQLASLGCLLCSTRSAMCQRLQKVRFCLSCGSAVGKLKTRKACWKAPGEATRVLSEPEARRVRGGCLMPPRPHLSGWVECTGGGLFSGSQVPREELRPTPGLPCPPFSPKTLFTGRVPILRRHVPPKPAAHALLPGRR